MDKIPITRQGYHALLRELAYLRGTVRPRVLEDLQEARSYGVNINNQQYMLARERYAVLQRKIQELEEKLECCEVVVGRKFFCRRVGFGTVIEIENLDTGETCLFQLVGPYESDVSTGKLSVYSPVGSCLMGCFEGEEVSVSTPGGLRLYRILSVQV
jgi:transcription elongation factor GreA